MQIKGTLESFKHDKEAAVKNLEFKARQMKQKARLSARFELSIQVEQHEEDKAMAVVEDNAAIYYQLETVLLDNQWLGGDLPCTADREVHEQLDDDLNVNKYPNAFNWYRLVLCFTPDVRSKWTGPAISACV